MNYRKLGLTGLEVSQLGFGLMRLPVKDGVFSQVDVPHADSMMTALLEGGVNYFDTAYPYHSADRSKGGASEPYLGDYVKGAGVRDKIIMATKLSPWLLKEPADMDRIFKDQLERLKTDYFDVYLLHNLDAVFYEHFKKVGALDFLRARIADGSIRHTGFSFHGKGAELAPILDDFGWDVVQVQYNYLDGDFQGGQTALGEAKKRGFGLVTMESLKGGFLTDRMPAAFQEKYDKAALGENKAHAALKWLFDKEEVSVVLSGMSSLAQVRDNLAICDFKPNTLTPDEKAKYEKLALEMKENVLVTCTDCKYCASSCPVGVDIPRNLELLNDLYINIGHTVPKMTGALKKNYIQVFIFYEKLLKNAKAGACVDCKKCTTVCPQKIDIPKFMAQAAEIFG